MDEAAAHGALDVLTEKLRARIFAARGIKVRPRNRHTLSREELLRAQCTETAVLRRAR